MYQHMYPQKDPHHPKNQTQFEAENALYGGQDGRTLKLADFGLAVWAPRKNKSCEVGGVLDEWCLFIIILSYFIDELC